MLLFLGFLLPALALDMGGELHSNFRSSPSGQFLDFQDSVVFSPWWEAGSNAKIKVNFDLALQRPSSVENIDDIKQISNIHPLSIRPKEFWLRTGNGRHQFTIGYQQHLWGVATGVSVLNLLNPMDLRDPTRFDQRLSNFMINQRSSFPIRNGNISVQTSVIPWFTPAQLPDSNIDVLPTANEAFSIDGQELDIRSAEGRLTLPEASASNIQAGLRITAEMSSIDVAIMAYHGFDSLPQANGELLLTGFQTDQGRIDVGIPLAFPTVDVIGLSSTVQLPLQSIGWMELSYTIPQHTVMTVRESQMQALETLGAISDLPSPLPQSTTQDGDPYLKWIVGVERFVGPVMLNFQWLHGFLSQRQGKDISDYGLLSMRWTMTPTFRFDAGTACTLEGALISGDFTALIGDEIEVGLGGVFTPATQSSLFSQYRDVQHLRLTTSMQF